MKGRYGRYVIALVIVLVCATNAIVAQNVNPENSTYDTRLDELPAAGSYEVFEPGQNPYSTYEQLRSGYMPVSFAFHGRRRERVAVCGVDLADGIVPSTVGTVPLKLRTSGYPADSLAQTWGELYGRRNYALDPFAVTGRVRRVGAVALAGAWTTGVNGRLSDEFGRSGYDLRLRSGFGPSAYGEGMESYGGYLSAMIRAGGWSVLCAVAPSVRGVRSASTDEAFELTGRTLYNPSLGVDRGRLRNANMRRECIPVLVANYGQMIDEQMRWDVSLVGRCGERSRSGLEWYNGLSPYPDHYRALPSGVDNPWAAEELRGLWRADEPTVTGVDWQTLRSINRANGRAQYLLTSQVERVATAGGVVALSGVAGATSWRVAVDARYDNSAFYSRIDDMLDAEYALNIDFFESELALGSVVYNDEEQRDRHLGVHDRVGYNYIIERLGAAVCGHADWRSGLWRVGVDFRGGAKSLNRRGLWSKSSRNDCYGKARAHLFADAAVDVSALWLRGMHSVDVQTWAASLVPEYRNIYLSPENSAMTPSHLSSGVDGGLRVEYCLRGSTLTARIAAHAATVRGAMEVYRYYDDLSGCYSDMVMSDIATWRVGVDVAADWMIDERWTLSAAATWLSERYADNPAVEVFADIDGEAIVEGARSGLKGMRTAVTPELVIMGEVSGRLSHGWRVNGSLVGFGGRYIEPNPLYRMERVRISAASLEEYEAIVGQRRLGNTLGVGIGASKSFEKCGVVVSLSVDGLVAGDRTNYAYEQMRLRRVDGGYVAAPVKRLYSVPLTAMFSISYTL